MRAKIHKILESAYRKEIARNILSSYEEIQNNYLLKKWKASELDAGHFVESVRRAIELELFGSYTPFTKKLSNFNDAVLKKYEKGKGDESVRILIPRILRSIYNIRSKRGVGHIGTISPNKMDSTLILYSAKWVLSELIKLKSNLSIQETQRLVDEIVQRQIELIWETGKIKRVLNTEMPVAKQVLILLLDKSPLHEDKLLNCVEYKNKTNFRKLLNYLHKKRLIESRQDRFCEISRLGVKEAEKIILGKK